MIESRHPIVARIASRGPLRLALLVASILLVLVSAVRFQAPELLGQHKVLTDFDAFHIAGRMAAEGRAADTYHMREMLVAQREATGVQSFMPWTYPPPFTLAMEGLAHLPIGFAFALFTLASFAFYTCVLRSIAGSWFIPAMIAVAPAIILNLRTGQNGFLIAGLIGLFLLAFRANRTLAGLPLGLMIIKPHLGVGVGLVTILKRRWKMAVLAAAVALALLGLATFAYGTGIWSDFRNAVSEAGGFLAKGYYPLFRMSSIYAWAFTFGFPPVGAMILQVIGAIAALLVLGWASVRVDDIKALSALTCIATLFVSPYGYDYDLTILGVALAFVLPDLVDRCAGWELLALLLLSWFVCGFGLAWTTIMSAIRPDTGVDLTAENAGIALIAPALVALCCWTAHILRRPLGAPAVSAALAVGLR